MGYEKQTWANGEIISAAKLNHMEDGIFGNANLMIVTITDLVETEGIGTIGKASRSTDEIAAHIMSGGIAVVAIPHEDTDSFQCGPVYMQRGVIGAHIFVADVNDQNIILRGNEVMLFTSEGSTTAALIPFSVHLQENKYITVTQTGDTYQLSETWNTIWRSILLGNLVYTYQGNITDIDVPVRIDQITQAYKDGDLYKLQTIGGVVYTAAAPDAKPERE